MVRALLESSLTNSAHFVNPPLPGILPGEHKLDRSNHNDLKRDINVNSLIISYDTDYDDCTNIIESNRSVVVANHGTHQSNHSNSQASTDQHRSHPTTKSNIVPPYTQRLTQNNQQSTTIDSRTTLYTREEIKSKANHHEISTLEHSKSTSVEKHNSSFGLKNSKLADVLKAVDGDIIFGNNSSNFNDTRSQPHTKHRTSRSNSNSRHHGHQHHHHMNRSDKNHREDAPVEPAAPVSITKISTKIFSRKNWFKTRSKKREKEALKIERHDYLSPLKKMLKSSRTKTSEDESKLALPVASEIVKMQSSSRRQKISESCEKENSRHRRHHRHHGENSDASTHHRHRSHRHHHHHHHRHHRETSNERKVESNSKKATEHHKSSRHKTDKEKNRSKSEKVIDKEKKSRENEKTSKSRSEKEERSKSKSKSKNSIRVKTGGGGGGTISKRHKIDTLRRSVKKDSTKPRSIKKHRKSVKVIMNSKVANQITSRQQQQQHDQHLTHDQVKNQVRSNLLDQQNVEFKVAKYLNESFNAKNCMSFELSDSLSDMEKGFDDDIIDLVSSSPSSITPISQKKQQPVFWNKTRSPSPHSLIYSDNSLNYCELPTNNNFSTLETLNDQKKQADAANNVRYNSNDDINESFTNKSKPKMLKRIEMETKKKRIFDAIEMSKNLRPPNTPAPSVNPATNNLNHNSSLTSSVMTTTTFHRRAVPLLPRSPPPPPPPPMPPRPSNPPPSIERRRQSMNTYHQESGSQLDFVEKHSSFHASSKSLHSARRANNTANNESFSSNHSSESVNSNDRVS